MSTIKRAIHFDFHTMPGIYDFNRDWDAAAFAQRLADAHVTFINMFAQCNLGFAYYPTKIGIPYPGMKGDMFGDMLTECHKRGIRVAAYINVGLNHEHLRRHPEWSQVDQEGRILFGDRTKNFFRTTCYNSPGYRRYLLDTIREICAYPIDGLFCDCMALRPCWCTKCTEDMLERGIDLNDVDAVTKFAYEQILSISAEIAKIVGPDRYLHLNGVPYWDCRQWEKHIEVECLPSGGWGYDTFAKQAAYARNIQDTVLYMTGRFQASWGDFGGYKTAASIENDCYDAIMNGCELSVGDHMHPAEIEERDIYLDIGKIYRKFERWEPWTDECRYLPEIGVLTDNPGYLGDTYSGVARILGELKYNFDILNVADDFSRFAVLILPDDLRVDEALAAKLSAHLEKGGKILSTGFAGLTPDGAGFALPAWEFDFDGPDPSDSSYFTFRALPEGTADMRWSDYREGIVMYAREGSTVLADHWKPYFNHGWDGKHGYYYTPPEKKTGHAAAAIAANGQVAHIAFRVFDAYAAHFLREHKRLVQQILEAFLPDKLLRTEKLNATSRVTATGCDRFTLVHCKVDYPELRGQVGVVEEHNVQPAGAKISLRGEYRAACILPDETPLDVTFENGYTTVTLPEFEAFAMVRFDR